MSATPVLMDETMNQKLNEVRVLQTRVKGQLRITLAAVWLTVDGQAVDHVLQPGDSLELFPGQRAVIEPWTRGSQPLLHWQPQALRQRWTLGWRFSAPADPACGPPVGHRAEPTG